jgi:hypothetical protein
MVGHWGFTHCRELMNTMKGINIPSLPPAPNPLPPL